MNCLKLNKILLLFLLFFFCKDFRADAKQSEVFDEYSRTHFFPREENEAFFEKQYGKAKEFLENKITTDEQINVNRLACFRTFYKNILEESDFYKEYKCGDPLFNEVLIDKCLFSQDYKKDIYLNEILKDCNGSKAFELVTILSFF